MVSPRVGEGGVDLSASAASIGITQPHRVSLDARPSAPQRDRFGGGKDSCESRRSNPQPRPEMTRVIPQDVLVAHDATRGPASKQATRSAGLRIPPREQPKSAQLWDWLLEYDRGDQTIIANHFPQCSETATRSVTASDGNSRKLFRIHKHFTKGKDFSGLRPFAAPGLLA